MNMVEHALRYAEAGIAIFPCRGKLPCTEHGFKDASTDEAQIKAWWQAEPTANIGLRTGRANNTLVLDVDAGKGGLETLDGLRAQHGDLETRTARTGGGGLHFYFLYPEGVWGNRAGFLPGLDIRGEGGYVIAPPSRHVSGRAYSWLVDSPRLPAPSWLLALLSRNTASQRWQVGRSRIPERIPEGQRNDSMFRMACRMRAEGANAAKIVEAMISLNGRCEPPLDATELLRLAESAARYPAGTSKKSQVIRFRNGLELRQRNGGAR